MIDALVGKIIEITDALLLELLKKRYFNPKYVTTYFNDIIISILFRYNNT